MKRKGASVSPCKIPVSVGNGLVSPSYDITVEVLSVYITLIAATVSSGIPYSLRISNIFDLSTVMQGRWISRTFDIIQCIDIEKVIY